MCEVVVLRHGERLDEAPGNTFYKDQPKRWFDPPLTERGILHAEAVAKKLQRELTEGGHPGFDVIATSPLLRTVQTAECLSSCTGIPLQIVPGLCECAAAVHDEGLHLQGDALALKRSGLLFYTIQELKSACPKAIWTESHPSWICPFEETVMRVCREAASAGHRRVVIVSHREGIRDLAGRHQRLSTPYCCVSRFEYAESLGIPSLAFKDSRELVKWDTHHMHAGTGTGTGI